MASCVVKSGTVFPWGGGREVSATLAEMAADRQHLCYWTPFALPCSTPVPSCSNLCFIFHILDWMVQEAGVCQPLHCYPPPGTPWALILFLQHLWISFFIPRVSRDGSSKNDALSWVLSLQGGGVTRGTPSRRSLGSPSAEAPGYLWGTSQHFCQDPFS